MPPSDTQHPLLDNPVRKAGSFWAERTAPDQKKLVAALAGLSDERGRFIHDAEALLTGRSSGRFDSWNFGLNYQARYAAKWLRPVRATVEGDLDQPLILESGDNILVMAGQRLSATASGVRINGFRLEDLNYVGAAATIGLKAGSYVLLPGMVSTITGDNFLHANVGDEDTLFLTREGTVSTDVAGLYETILHDTWFIPCPKGEPDILLTRKGPRVRNQGFVQVDKWLAVFEDPKELWPDSNVTVLAGSRGAPSARASAMGADQFNLGSREVMTYLRSSQGPVRFERALSTLGGDAVPEFDMLVEKVTPAENGHHYWSGGRSTYLAGPPEYVVGETMQGGRGARIRVYSKWSDGYFWRHPAWGGLTISSKWFWPRLPEVKLKGGNYMARAYGAPVRTRISTGEAGEDAFWDALDAEGELTTVLGFTVAGETQTVNLVDLFFDLLGERLMVVASTLHASQPARWHQVRSWAERERPTGCVLIPALLESIRIPTVFGDAAAAPIPITLALQDDSGDLWRDDNTLYYLFLG